MRIVACLSGQIDLVNPIHLLFNIWAIASAFVDFDVQIGAVHGKVSVDEAGFAVATKGR